MRPLRISLLLVQVVWLISASYEANAQVVVAHAGGKGLGPENTVPTISSSFDVGTTWVEVDVRLTADAVAMLMHDSTVDRTTDGTGAIGLMSMAAVKLLDAGSYFGPEFVGVEVPTFEEALVAALGRGPILIDMKDATIGSQVATALTNVGATPDDIILWTNSTGEVSEAQTFLPGSKIFYQTTTGSEALLQSLAGLGVDGVSILYVALTPDLVEFGHTLGLDVFVWGANSPDRIAETIFWGIDGIHHVDPEFVLNFIAEDDCSDGADNDQDGSIDFPDDTGCSSPTDGSERSTSICDDGMDNDGDGLIDYPFDLGCSSILGTTEQSLPVPLLSPFACIMLGIALAAASLSRIRGSQELT